jgi:hypothetical protein
MNMKKLIMVIQLALLSIVLLGQNGTYKCNSQRFTDQKNPSRNAEHYNAMIITIDINDYTGGFVLVNSPSEDVSYKWDILEKLESRTNSKTNSVYTFYDARFSAANVRATSKAVVILIKEIGTGALHLGVDNPEAGTTLLYQNLAKIQL